MSSHTKKVAIVTGASQGIGEGLVKAYRERGYAVVATARTVRATGDEQVIAVPGDIQVRATAERAVATALERFGRVDTLVNNAGVFIAKPFIDFSQEDFELVTGVNTTGFFHITQLVAREMVAKRAGHIVTITASLAEQPREAVPSVLASITKGGLIAATKGLAIELAKQGVRVNAVSPGIVKTPMHKPETYDYLASLHPVARMGEVEDIAKAVLYLESAPFVTGEILHVDGGWHAGAA